MNLYCEKIFRGNLWQVFHEGGSTIIMKNGKEDCRFAKLMNAALVERDGSLYLMYTTAPRDESGWLLE